MTDSPDFDYNRDYALPAIRRELIRAANRADPPLSAREVKTMFVWVLKTYPTPTLMNYIEEDIKLDFAIGAYRTSLDKKPTVK